MSKKRGARGTIKGELVVVLMLSDGGGWGSVWPG
jgi:hypothetical protein